MKGTKYVKHTNILFGKISSDKDFEVSYKSRKLENIINNIPLFYETKEGREIRKKEKEIPATLLVDAFKFVNRCIKAISEKESVKKDANNRSKNFTDYSYLIFCAGTSLYQAIKNFPNEWKQPSHPAFELYKNFLEQAYFCAALSGYLSEEEDGPKKLFKLLAQEEKSNGISFKLKTPTIPQQYVIAEEQQQKSRRPKGGRRRGVRKKEPEEQENKKSSLNKFDLEIYGNKEDRGNIAENINRINKTARGEDFFRLMNEEEELCTSYINSIINPGNPRNIEDLSDFQKAVLAYAYVLRGNIRCGKAYYLLKNPMPGEFVPIAKIDGGNIGGAESDYLESMALSSFVDEVSSENIKEARRLRKIITVDISEMGEKMLQELLAKVEASKIKNDEGQRDGEEEIKDGGQDAPPSEDVLLHQPQLTNQDSVATSRLEHDANAQSAGSLQGMESKGDNEDEPDMDPSAPAAASSLPTQNSANNSQGPSNIPNSSDRMQNVVALKEALEAVRKREEAIRNKEKELKIKEQKLAEKERDAEVARENASRDNMLSMDLITSVIKQQKEVSEQNDKAGKKQQEANEQNEKAVKILQEAERKQSKLEEQEQNLTKGRAGLDQQLRELEAQKKGAEEWEKGIIKKREESEQEIVRREKELVEQSQKSEAMHQAAEKDRAAASEERQRAEEILRKAETQGAEMGEKSEELEKQRAEMVEEQKKSEAREKESEKQKAELNEKLAAKDGQREKQVSELNAELAKRNRASEEQEKANSKQQQELVQKIAEQEAALAELERRKTEENQERNELEIERAALKEQQEKLRQDFEQKMAKANGEEQAIKAMIKENEQLAQELKDWEQRLVIRDEALIANEERNRQLYQQLYLQQQQLARLQQELIQRQQQLPQQHQWQGEVVDPVARRQIAVLSEQITKLTKEIRQPVVVMQNNSGRVFSAIPVPGTYFPYNQASGNVGPVFANFPSQGMEMHSQVRRSEFSDQFSAGPEITGVNTRSSVVIDVTDLSPEGEQKTNQNITPETESIDRGRNILPSSAAAKRAAGGRMNEQGLKSNASKPLGNETPDKAKPKEKPSPSVQESRAISAQEAEQMRKGLTSLTNPQQKGKHRR
ncbi:MAG: hypothetical protein K0R25_398 [Rickettsiaceae bacterium]|jgi:hypothetical protein|nr:hypothetical protein [Rickettsiaceae bacterium]